MSQRKKYKFIILILIGLLFLLLLVLLLILKMLEEPEKFNISTNVTISDETSYSNREKSKTVEDIVEEHGSEYLTEEKKIYNNYYVKFKYDLFDDDGKSQKSYFVDLLEEVVNLNEDSYYMIDNEKRLSFFVLYDKEHETYKITINNMDFDEYFDNTDGEIYMDLKESKLAGQANFVLSNYMLWRITSNYSYYGGTELATGEKEDLGNGYYSYRNGAIKARLRSGKALNILLNKNYEEELFSGITTRTSLEEMSEKFPTYAFGSIGDGYLGYRTDTAYAFFYNDEVSIYSFKYEKNDYFDKYLKDYCDTGDLDKLYSDFTTEWTNYFEKEYNPETKSLRVFFPTRGIDIDIKGNDSKGIKIYNNYYLTETVTDLIKAHKITFVADEDSVNVAEQVRRGNG